MGSRAFSAAKSSSRHRIRAFRPVAFAIAVLIALAPAVRAQQQSSNTPPETEEKAVATAPPKAMPAKLLPGVQLEKMLQGGETQSYEIRAEKGQFLHATVEQHGIDVALTFDAPDGKPIATMDSPNGQFGLEQLSVVSDAAGIFVLEIASGDKSVPAGKYKLRFDAPRAPSDADRIRLRAEATFNAAGQLEGPQTADSMRDASKKYEESAPLWRQTGDTYEECVALNESERILETLGELDKSEELARRVLELA